ncbi:integral membrane protein 2Cb isoform X1 [Syngnathus typhle]|uniref:integral membrane protein 2Cb isoform X1 n=1 Tax=Syngnathus typhle TaxID=161592 RepID=UPI002A6A9FFA|nr:integral membrane protein 2Cb isoform X1 [Syngnathus typhle]
MVRISFRQASADKVDKDETYIDETDQESNQAQIKRYFPVRLCLIMFSGLAIFLGMLLGSIYTYRHFFPAELSANSNSSFNRQVPGLKDLDQDINQPTDVFKCNVLLNWHQNRMALVMAVGIYLEGDNHYIRIDLFKAGHEEPVSIIHDFANLKTAYYAKKQHKCYVTELNTNLVKAPRNLWDVLTFTKREMYLPDNYKIQEVMQVTRQLHDHEDLGGPIQGMCRNLTTFEMVPKDDVDSESGNYESASKQESTNDCLLIRHLENRYFVETNICY